MDNFVRGICTIHSTVFYFGQMSKTFCRALQQDTKAVHGKTGKINILQINERMCIQRFRQKKKKTDSKKKKISPHLPVPSPPPPTPIRNIMVRL